MKRDLQEETDAFVDFLNEWGAKHLGPKQVSGGAVAIKASVESAGVSCGHGAQREAATGRLDLPSETPAGIHLVDAEIALGTHAQNCMCGDCRLAQKYEE